MNKNMLLIAAAGVGLWFFMKNRKAAPAGGTTVINQAPEAANPWITTGLTVGGNLLQNLLSGGNAPADIDIGKD